MVFALWGVIVLSLSCCLVRNVQREPALVCVTLMESVCAISTIQDPLYGVTGYIVRQLLSLISASSVTGEHEELLLSSGRFRILILPYSNYVPMSWGV